MDLMIDQEKLHTTDILNEESVDFENLLLSDSLLHGLHDIGFKKPSQIQLKAIPIGKCGFDLIVQSKNGTGKTCVFSVIALEAIDVEAKCIQVLILAPTREIAFQINEVLITFSRYMNKICCQLFIGGTSLADDAKRLKKCHIAIATPGRFEHFLKEGIVDYSSIRLFILDEADKLLEKEFEDAINWIYSSLPVSKQIIACSATMPEWLAISLQNYMHQPVTVRLNSLQPDLIGVAQYIKVVKPLQNENTFKAKCRILLSILPSINFTQCIIYSSNQIRGEDICDMLIKSGWSVAVIGAGQDQEVRLQAIYRLKSKECSILVSTDLTSRGLDVPNVDLVVNVDLPMTFDTYLHRIGRAGRFGRYGASITLVSEGNEQFKMQRITKLCHIRLMELPDIIPDDLIKHTALIVQVSTSTEFNCDQNLKNLNDRVMDFRSLNNNSCDKLVTDLQSYMNGDFNTNLGVNIDNNENNLIPNSNLINNSLIDKINSENLENNCLKTLQNILNENLTANNLISETLVNSNINIDENYLNEEANFRNNANDLISLSNSNLTYNNLQISDQHLQNEYSAKYNNNTSKYSEEFKIQNSDNLLLKLTNVNIDEMNSVNSEENKENIVYPIFSNLNSENNLSQFKSDTVEILPDCANIYSKKKTISMENKPNLKILKYSIPELYDIGKNLKNIRINNKIKKVVSNLRILKNSQVFNSKQTSFKNKFDKNKAPIKNIHNKDNIETKNLQQSSNLLNLNITDNSKELDTNLLENREYQNSKINSVINFIEVNDYSKEYTYDNENSKICIPFNKTLQNQPNSNDIYSGDSINFCGDYKITQSKKYKELDNSDLFYEKLNNNIQISQDITKSGECEKNFMDESKNSIDKTKVSKDHNLINLNEVPMIVNKNNHEDYSFEGTSITNDIKVENSEYYKLSKINSTKTKHAVRENMQECNDYKDYYFLTKNMEDSKLDCSFNEASKLNKSGKLANNIGDLYSKYCVNEASTEKQRKESSNGTKKKKSKKYKLPDLIKNNKNIHDRFYSITDEFTAFFYWSQYQYHLNMAQQYKQQYELLINHQKNYSMFNNCIDYIKIMSGMKEP